MGSLTRLSTGEVIKPNDYSPKILQSLPKKESSSSVEKSKSNAFPRKNNLPGSAVSRGADRIVNALSSVYSEEDAKPTGWGQVAKGTLLKGADLFVNRITSTGKMVEGWITKPLEKATGVEGLAESGPWAVLDRVMKNAQQYNTDQFKEDFESKGKAGEILDKYGTATVSVMPQAAIALMSAGLSLGAQAGGAGLQAAGASSGLASTIGSAASSLARNPQFWLSVSQTAGPAYEEAKADGATDAQASSYALLTSLVNSVVEVGGGIETLPTELQQAARGGKNGLKVWFNGMLDEGKEEVIQGAISQMSQALYGKQNPIFSTTDQNAVISPSRAADEFLGGAVVGGVLGGGQIAANRILSGPRSLQTGVQEAAQVQSRENTDSPQDVETVMPSVIQEIMEQPVARALRRYVETGTVTNSDATSILQDIDSLYALRKYGVEIQDGMTNSQKRSAVKNGIADMANQADATVSPVNFEQYPNLNRYMDAAESYGLKTGVQAAEQAQQSKVPEAQFFQNVQAQNAQDTQANVQSVGAAPAGFDPYSNQLKRYGAIPEGENPYRQIDVPQRTAPDNRVSYSARTILEAAATPDSAVGDIGQAVVDGKFSYIPISNKSAQSTAEATVKRLGYQGALAQFMSDVESGKSSEKVTALGLTLYNNAVNSGDTMGALDIAYHLSKSVRSGARATQAMRILKKLTPSGQLYMIQKEVNDINEQNARKSSRKSKTSSDNVPVELWMQRVGENLADSLASKTKVPKERIQTVTQTILSDLKRYANEIVPKQLPTGRKRTEMDRIMDLFQNKAAYDEAWQASRYTFMDTFENNPEILSAYDQWLDSSLDYTSRLTKELTGQSEITIDTDLADAFLNASTEAERAAALDAIYQNIADQMPADWKMKWNSWRYMAMLANPRTHVRNIIGNIGFQPLRFVKNEVAAGMEAALNLAGVNVEKTKSFAYNPDLYRAAWQDYDSAKDLMSGNRIDDAGSEIQSRRRVFKNGILESIRTKNYDALEFEDAIFKKITYADTLASYLNANGVTAEQLRSGNVNETLLEKAREYAAQEAMRATYQDRNVVSDKVVSVAKSLGTFGEAVLPFKRTPANILVRGFEYSPLGLTKSLTADLVRVKNGSLSATDAIDNVAKGLTGSALMALGAFLASLGIVSGGEGDDQKQADLNNLTGGQSYAIDIDGKSYTLDWLAPESLPFFMGVELVNALGEEGFTADSISSAFSSISEPMLEMSMLQSLNDLIDNVSYAASNQKLKGILRSVLVNYLSQAIPTILGQAERSGQDTRMTTYTDKNSWVPTDAQYALGKASAKIPGWDYQQIPYIDAWGRTESSGPLSLRTFDNFLNPSYRSEYNVTPIDEEIQRLYDSTGDGSVVPSRAQKYITVDGERIDLTADQYVQYATEKGQMSYVLASQMIDNATYKSLPDKTKVDIISAVYDYADSLAKEKVSTFTPSEWIQKIASSGVDPVTAILYHRSDAHAETKRKMLMQDTSLSASERSALDRALISENSDVDYTNEETFTITQMSESAQEKWERAKNWGMPYEDYAKYYPILYASGKKKDEIIQDLINAGMSERNAYNFWDLIKKD